MEFHQLIFFQIKFLKLSVPTIACGLINPSRKQNHQGNGKQILMGKLMGNLYNLNS